MASRREIREAAIQFLYCADIEGSNENSELYGEFWHIVLESDQKKLTNASIKALLHLNSGRVSRHAKLVERSPEAIATIKTIEEAEPLAIHLETLLQQESKWQALCDSVLRLSKSEAESAHSESLDTLKEVFVLNRGLMEMRKRYHELLLDFPQLKNKLEATTAAINGLDRIAGRILMVENPDAYPDRPEISHLRESCVNMASYRDAVDELVKGVLNRKDDIDKTIEGVVDNFTPTRIDPVDRAIIRLAVFEILFREDVPSAVAINEALEICKRFGSSDSSRFANGILDAVAKTIEKTS